MDSEPTTSAMDLSEACEFPVELRKIRRLDGIFKKKDKDLDEKMDDKEPPKPPEELMQMLVSSDTTTQLQALISIKAMMLEGTVADSVQIFLNMDIVPKCVDLIASTEIPGITNEALLILHWISYGNASQTRVLLENEKLINLMIDLFDSSINLAEKAALTLGNIAADSVYGRDRLLEFDLIGPLVDLCNRYLPLSFLRHMSWFLATLFRSGNIAAKFPALEPLLPVLLKTLKESKDHEVMFNITLALQRLTYDGDEVRVRKVCEAGFVKRLIKILNIANNKTICAALRTLTNMSSGSQIKLLIDGNILAKMPELLNNTDRYIVRHCLAIVSNICADTQKHIQAVIDNDVFDEVEKVLKEGPVECKLGAATVVTNLTKHATAKQVMEVFDSTEMLRHYSNLLNSNEVNIVKEVVSGLWHLLKMAEGLNRTKKMCASIETVGALEKLETLQYHDNETIQKNAAMILDRFFSKDTEDGTTKC